ncbi:MAG: hypothetical protein ACTSRA_00655 [Promethearchaeota archaeon]|nr:MAG: vaccinia I7 processing peptidase-like protein [Helarchaeota virus Nidhogg Meg22_1012]URC17468.1 MAG: vaccinia I7 processing peptidase-like protein [Helarchaeota virus Nidhogg Meg22_1214]
MNTLYKDDRVEISRIFYTLRHDKRHEACNFCSNYTRIKIKYKSGKELRMCEICFYARIYTMGIRVSGAFLKEFTISNKKMINSFRYGSDVQVTVFYDPDMISRQCNHIQENKTCNMRAKIIVIYENIDNNTMSRNYLCPICYDRHFRSCIYDETEGI